MQTSNHRANQHPDTLPPWILFVEVMGGDVSALPNQELMDGRQLEDTLAPHLDRLEIVISDWRALHAPLEAFRQRLPAALAKRVVDTVFLPELTNSSWSDYYSTLATRHACLRLWLDRQRPLAGDRWMAIEQDGLLDTWPAREREHVILGTIAQPRVVHQLIARLNATFGTPGTANPR